MGTPDAAHFPCLTCLPQAGLRLDLWVITLPPIGHRLFSQFRSWCSLQSVRYNDGFV